MGKEIHVYTLNENPKLSREELKFATKYMYSLLVSRKIHDNTNISIESKEVHDKQELEGQVRIIGDIDKKSPRNFHLLLNTKSSKNRQLLTLAHELVHVKQFAKNQLGISWEEDGVNYCLWKKRKINVDRRGYWNLDWEIEAFGRQEGLLHRYKKFIKEHEIKFD